MKKIIFAFLVFLFTISSTFAYSLFLKDISGEIIRINRAGENATSNIIFQSGKKIVNIPKPLMNTFDAYQLILNKRNNVDYLMTDYPFPGKALESKPYYPYSTAEGLINWNNFFHISLNCHPTAISDNVYTLGPKCRIISITPDASRPRSCLTENYNFCGW